MFQQVPLNIIESNTELISYYRKKRDVDVYTSGISGLSINSVDSWESLTERAKLALAAMSTTTSSSSNLQNDQAPKADSFFKEKEIIEGELNHDFFPMK